MKSAIALIAIFSAVAIHSCAFANQQHVAVVVHNRGRTGRRSYQAQRHRLLESDGPGYPTYSPTSGDDDDSYPTWAPTKKDDDDTTEMPTSDDDPDDATTTAATTTNMATDAVSTTTTIETTTAATLAAAVTTQATTTPALPPTCPQALDESIIIDPKATLHYAIVPSSNSNNGILCGRLEASNENGWIGLGFSTDGGMVGSQAIIGIPDDGTVIKYDLNGKSQEGVIPMSSDKQTLRDTSISVREEDGMTIMEFTKLLVEGNNMEIPILQEGVNTFLHARGQSSLGYHYNGRFIFTRDFAEGVAAVAVEASSSATAILTDPIIEATDGATTADGDGDVVGSQDTSNKDGAFEFSGAETATTNNASSNGSTAAAVTFMSLLIMLVLS